MFDPRKLMPLSMEDCSAPIAVITEITEKTPIVIPIIVSAARSLLAPNDASAILMISLNNISLTPAFRPVTLRRRLRRSSQKPLETALSIAREWHRPERPVLMIHLMSYSYLSAATGSRRDADHAGAKPENKPVKIETAILTTTKLSENRIGNEGNACQIAVHIKYETPRPINQTRSEREVD